MDRAETLKKVIEVVADTLEIDASKLDENTQFSDLGADSFDLLELVTAFEDEFDETLEDEELDKIKTIGDALNAVENAR